MRSGKRETVESRAEVKETKRDEERYEQEGEREKIVRRAEVRERDKEDR